MHGRSEGNDRRSFSSRPWQDRTADPETTLRFAQRHGLPELLASVIVSRGVAEAELARHLAPRLKDWLPDPSLLPGMDALADRLAWAVQREETVALFGDYDVDGQAAVALLSRFLAALGVRVLHAVPHRLRDGYGPNERAFRDFVAAGAGVIVCLDCGSNAAGPIAAISREADVLVLDHHRSERLPSGVVAHVNPNTPPVAAALSTLCATALAFLAAVAINRNLRRAGFARTVGNEVLLDLVDLVALATVADVMPLVGLNRAFVARGIEAMRRSPRPGLAALAAAAGVGIDTIDAEAIGFALAPRLNAAGRLDDAGLGVALLLTNDAREAQSLAQRLDRLNRDRQSIEAVVAKAAFAEAERQVEAGRSVLVVAGEGWHPGVVGIVAGRLRERFGRPAVALAVAGETAVGSGRSVPGFDLGAAIGALVQQGLVLKGGGHAEAAGVTLAASRLGAFAEALDAAWGVKGEVQEPVVIEGRCRIEGATPEAAQALARLGPFGPGNAEPLVELVGRVASVSAIGARGTHLRVVLAGEGGGSLAAIAFRVDGSPLAQGLAAARGSLVRVAGALRPDRLRGGEAVWLRLVDAAFA